MILLLPILVVILLVAAVVVLRNSMGDEAPSWLRGTTIAIGLAFVFFVLSGLGVVMLIVGLVTANAPVVIAAIVFFVLAVAGPILVWLSVRPGLRRLRAEERVRAEAARAEFEARWAERQSEAEHERRERLRAAAQAAERARLRSAGASSAAPSSAPVYYEILGLTVAATSAEIEAAYRREMREHHPDRGGESRRAQLINEAYETLRDPRRRVAYDRENGLR